MSVFPGFTETLPKTNESIEWKNIRGKEPSGQALHSQINSLVHIHTRHHMR